MSAGRLRERCNIGVGLLSKWEHIANKIVNLQREVIAVPASGPAHFPGAGDTQNQGLHTQPQSPVGLAKKHMSAKAYHYEALRLTYSAADQDAISASIFTVRKNSWRVTSDTFGQDQKDTKADNKGVCSVKSCKYTNPASKF
jgi:hypothetical protein